MSGGHFDYKQHHITDIINDIETLINNNNIENEYGYKEDFSNKTLNEFKIAIKILKKAHIYTQRIDWLVSGDDGEETFHNRLKEDLIANKH